MPVPIARSCKSCWIFWSSPCVVIAGADNWEDVEAFGKAWLEWFQTFLELPNGVPSHDAFIWGVARLYPE
uniref:Transposase family protein n=1 Tax=Anaerolinea thermolimosa TaxID=229919 RepID=A0A7C4KHC2_9CHLR